MRNKIIGFSKNYFIYILEFLFFFYIFYITPPICDRWIEKSIYSTFEYPFRYVIGQIRWAQIANARVFSNCFSYFVDYNIIVHSFVNATMMVFLSISGILISGRGDKLTKLISVLLPLMLSFGIWREVYFYATTLYLSTACIVLFWIIYMCRKKWSEYKNSTKIKIFIALIVSSLWLENLSLLLTVMFFCYFIYHSCKNKRISFEYLAYLFCAVCGLAVMLISSVYAKLGRINQEQGVSGWSVARGRLHYTYEQDSFLFMILALVMICFFLKKNHLVHRIQLIGWLVILFDSLANSMVYLYRIISVDPKDVEFVVSTFGWENFKSYGIDRIVGTIEALNDKLIVFIILYIIVSCSFVINSFCKFKKAETALGISLLCALVTAVSLNYGDRLYSLYLFILSVLIVILASESSALQEKAVVKLYPFLLVILFIQAFTKLIFINKQYEIANERKDIAQNVAIMQAEGSWNYDSYVIMPKMSENSIGEELAGGNRKNPLVGDAYYKILLKYYGLDENTRIVFSDTHQYFIVIIDKEHNYLSFKPMDMECSDKFEFEIKDGDDSIYESGWLNKDVSIDIDDYYDGDDIELCSFIMLEDKNGTISTIDNYGIFY